MPRKPPGKPPSQRANRRDRPEPDRQPGPNDIRYIAIHEAGHAVSAVLFGTELRSVDIKQRRMPNGHISMGFTDTAEQGLAPGEADSQQKAKVIIIESMAGPLAEMRVNPRVLEGGAHQGDKEDARRVAAIALCEMEDKGGGNMEISTAELKRNKDRIDTLIQSAIEEADALVAANWSAIERVAGLLIERKSLTGAEVAEIVQTESLQRDVAIGGKLVEV